jgi:PiT family inorganic phosphate transporter
VGLVALAMAAGGLIDARKVAETVSHKITAMDHGEGFTANLITSVLVIGASRWGLPVSTTHVSCGALFGIGIANGQARWHVIRNILSAWLLTLPIAGASAALAYVLLSGLMPS